MRVVIQRVQEATVRISERTAGSIAKGLLVLAGFDESDTAEDIEWLAGKIVRLRIFSDKQGLMNRSINEINGEILVVSQFTLHASTKKGNRPSFIRAARPEKAIPLYDLFLKQLQSELSKEIQSGEFGAEMQVYLVNDGPVTIIMDTKNKE